MMGMISTVTMMTFSIMYPNRSENGLLERQRPKGSQSSKRTITDADIAKHLTAKSKDELVGIVMQICRSDRKVKQSFIDRIMLETGDHSAVVREARKELRSVTSEEAWFNSWEGHGNLPDYSRLRSRLQALIDAEQFDAVVELGRELIERGLRQVEQSHDEGETAGEIMRTLSIVAQTIVPSSMSASEKILFVIDALLQDDYDLCDGFGDVLDQGFPKAAWAQVRAQVVPAPRRSVRHRRGEPRPRRPDV